jgi:hypothetical protein
MVHSDECPVSNDTGDAKGAVGIRPSDEVFDGSSVKELDVGEG